MELCISGRVTSEDVVFLLTHCNLEVQKYTEKTHDLHFLSNIIILLTNYTITYFSYTNKMMQCGLDIVTKNKKTIHYVQHGCYFLSHHTLVYESFSVFTLLSKKSLKIPKGGNQNPYIKEEQTTQWPKDTKGVIRTRISKKNRKHNGQKKMHKRTNNDLQNIHIKLKIE
jgi:hypothetical protein